MSNHTHKMFADYEMHVSISLRRKTDRYSSDVLAEAEVKETLAIAERDLALIFKGFIDACREKALSALAIKHTYEREMMALEAGDTVDA